MFPHISQASVTRNNYRNSGISKIVLKISSRIADRAAQIELEILTKGDFVTQQCHQNVFELI